MEITDIRVKLIHESKERLRAVCSVTFDDAFVVRDVKVVEGTSGTFVAMPSRKLSSHCPKCRHKNQIRARFCNECGGKLPPPRPPEDGNGRSRFHRDIAHPINTEFREMIQEKVLEAFAKESEENGGGFDESAPPEPKADSRRVDPHTPDEPAGEFHETREQPEVREQPSEYDSLIAGLHAGGRRGKESDSADRPRQGRQVDRSERKRQEDARGGHRSGRDQPAKRKDQVVEQATPSTKQPADPISETSFTDTAGDNDGTQFGADIVIETPAKTTTEHKPEPAIDVVETIDDDDDAGFGAGLI